MTTSEAEDKSTSTPMVETDRTSDLPDDILYDILIRAVDNSARRMVELSTVSRTWKQLCGSACAHIFNNYLDREYLLVTDQNRSSSTTTEETDPCSGSEDQFVTAVNQLIQFHKHASMSEFRVSFCLGMDSASHIDSWVRFALSKGVRRMHLFLSCKHCPRYEEDGTCIFHLDEEAGEYGSQLEELGLGNFILGQGWHKQLSSLNQLHLYSITLGQLDLDTILSGCLKLQTLRLVGCVLPTKICIFGSAAMRLTTLGLRFCFEVQTVELIAAHLLNLEYEGGSITFSALEVPNLKQLFFKAYPESEVSAIKSLLSKCLLPHVLTVVAPTNWVHSLSEGTFCRNVIELHLDSEEPNDMDMDVSKINAILKAFPLMEVLSLSGTQFSGEINSDVQYVHKNLKKIELYGFYGTWDALDFAASCLSCIPIPSISMVMLCRYCCRFQPGLNEKETL